jgi:DNA-binding transcriptional ArsR family regulator
MNTHSDHLDATFSALADPTRRAILARLTLGEATVMELTKPFAMSQPAISKHLQVLERAGLISRGRNAQKRPCRIEPVALAEATGWLDGYRQFWENRFQHLDTLLAEMQSGDEKADGNAESTQELSKPSQSRSADDTTK